MNPATSVNGEKTGFLIMDLSLSLLHEENSTKQVTACEIAPQLIDHWVWCNVHTLSSKGVTQKIVNIVTFSKLARYPKQKKCTAPAVLARPQ